MHGEAVHTVFGRYLAVDAGRRLEFSWRWQGRELETPVTVTIEAQKQGCQVSIQHSSFPDAETREQHEEG